MSIEFLIRTGPHDFVVVLSTHTANTIASIRVLSSLNRLTISCRLRN